MIEMIQLAVELGVGGVLRCVLQPPRRALRREIPLRPQAKDGGEIVLRVVPTREDVLAVPLARRERVAELGYRRGGRRAGGPGENHGDDQARHEERAAALPPRNSAGVTGRRRYRPLRAGRYHPASCPRR